MMEPHICLRAIGLYVMAEETEIAGVRLKATRPGRCA